MHRIIILILAAFSSQNSYSYSCEETPSIEELFDNSSIAIIGKIEKKLFELYFSKDKYLVTISSSRKGEVPSSQIVVWTSKRDRCGATFEVGKEFVIFLLPVEGKFWTDINYSWPVERSTDHLTQEFLDFVD